MRAIRIRLLFPALEIWYMKVCMFILFTYMYVSTWGQHLEAHIYIGGEIIIINMQVVKTRRDMGRSTGLYVCVCVILYAYVHKFVYINI